MIQNGIIINGVVYEFTECDLMFECEDCALADECFENNSGHVLCRQIFNGIKGDDFVQGKRFIKREP